jgi:hypothetical protein
MVGKNQFLHQKQGAQESEVKKESFVCLQVTMIANDMPVPRMALLTLCKGFEG